MHQEPKELVTKVLGEPIVLRLDDELAKTRARLLAVSTVSIAIVVAELHIKPGSSLLGLQIENLTDQVVHIGLAIVTTYLLMHFLWGAADGFREWRVRLTGSRHAADFIGAWGGHGGYGDTPRHPRYSTLYNWWRERANDLSNVQDAIADVQAKLQSMQGPEPHDVSTSTLKQLVEQLSGALNREANVMENPRLLESLGRFDRAFHSLRRSENLRWIVFDWGLPTIIGAAALAFLVAAICSSTTVATYSFPGP